MTLVSWLIVIFPVLFILGIAFYSKRYVRDVADYLACGRVAGRYVISVGDLAVALSVITLIAAVEQYYQSGLALRFWSVTTIPITIFMSLTGYCVYRFRQTRCLSMGQFLEIRYSRSFRIVAAIVRTLSEMIANSIGPAVAVRFFIYFIGIPHKIPILGFEMPTYGILVALAMAMAMAVLWPGGRISLLITDCFQGMISYPIFIVFTVFVLTQISWFSDVTPVMLDRVHGESFLNPMDISELRDFNLFALIVIITSTILGRGAWLGNDSTNAARNPHEQKMANILGAWRQGFSSTMTILISIFVIVFMFSDKFSSKSHEVRIELTKKVAEEVIENSDSVKRVLVEVSTLKPIPHKIGVDAPYSRENNPDVQFWDATRTAICENQPDNGNAVFQEFKTLYNQMMMPTMLGNLFSPVLMGLFTLLMIMLLLSTDASRIFNASSTIIQDVIVPLRKTPLSIQEHLTYIRLCSLGTALFFLAVSLFFKQLDYIFMFVTLMVGVWVGASGPIMIGGLYTRFGTTFGAWCALIFGSGTAVTGLICQRHWTSIIYPWLEKSGYVEPVGNFLTTISSPFHPYVVWVMDPTKAPINSMEIYFMSILFAVAAYIIGSLLTYKEPYNLDRLFHRGKYRDENSASDEKIRWTWRSSFKKLICITPEYTIGDKIIAWSAFIWSVVYGFGIMFCGVLLWNWFSPWSSESWSIYFFIATVVTSIIIGTVSTVWFLIGGIIDTRAMFRDLKKRTANPLDDGRVYGHVSLADRAHFDEVEHQSDPKKE
ncbi:MAG: sodium:panthothenate symporter [Phycisphaerae bacterium]